MKRKLIFSAAALLAFSAFAFEPQANKSEDLGNFVTLQDYEESERGPADPLSYLHIYAVRSPEGGYEDIPYGTHVTKLNHGGSYIEIYTEEVGFGGSPIAQYYGQMQMISVTPIYNSNGIAVSFKRVFRHNGNTIGGKIEYSNISSNKPWNLMQDWIQIQ